MITSIKFGIKLLLHSQTSTVSIFTDVFTCEFLLWPNYACKNNWRYIVVTILLPFLVVTSQHRVRIGCPEQNERSMFSTGSCRFKVNKKNICFAMNNDLFGHSWGTHDDQMKTFTALLALCTGNSPVTGEFPPQRPMTQSFYIFFYLRLNKQLSKQSRRRWFETPSPSLSCHCNGLKDFHSWLHH